MPSSGSSFVESPLVSIRMWFLPGIQLIDSVFCSSINISMFQVAFPLAKEVLIQSNQSKQSSTFFLRSSSKTQQFSPFRRNDSALLMPGVTHAHHMPKPETLKRCKAGSD